MLTGNRPNRAEPLERDEEELLWSSGMMGDHSPYALQCALWYLTSKFCGFRASDESRKLKWGDLQLKYEGEEPVLVYRERQTKTRTGDTDDTRKKIPKLHLNKEHPERCPILLHDAFRSKRPAEMMSEDSPFYLTINSPGWERGGNWFRNQAMGKHTLIDFMKTMCQNVGISGRKTNHSVRKTTITQLMQSNTPPTFVQTVSGHKNVNSLLNYATPSKSQEMEMVGILEGKFSRFGDPSNVISSTPQKSQSVPLQHSASVIPASTATATGQRSLRGDDTPTDSQLAKVIIPSQPRSGEQRPKRFSQSTSSQKKTATPPPAAATATASTNTSLVRLPPSQLIQGRDSEEEFVTAKPRVTKKKSQEPKHSTFELNFTESSDSSSDDAPVAPPPPPKKPDQPPSTGHAHGKGRRVPGKDKGKSLMRSHTTTVASTSRHESSSDDFEEITTSQRVTKRRGRRCGRHMSHEDCEKIAEIMVQKMKKQKGNNFFNCNVYF